MSSPVPAPLPRRRLAWLAFGLVAAALLWPALETYRVYAGANDHTVIPDRVYRAAQPTEKELKGLIEKNRIRTVLNLRGTTPWDGWYQGECRATFAADVSQEDVALSANTLPFPAELKRVVEVLDRSEYPVLVHCKQGADRTGLVSAMALLLYTDATLPEARQQMWPRYGHWPVVRTANIDRFFDLYEQKLASEGGTHTPERFRRWVLHEYCPGPARSKLGWKTTPPGEVEQGTPFTVTVLCENHSDIPWQLKPGTFAGVHVCYAVYGERPTAAWEGRAGLRNETVPPGGTTEVIVPVGKLPPGKYRLVIELHDATGASIPFRTQSFTKFGDDSLVAEFSVR